MQITKIHFVTSAALMVANREESIVVFLDRAAQLIKQLVAKHKQAAVQHAHGINPETRAFFIRPDWRQTERQLCMHQTISQIARPRIERDYC